MPQRNPTLCAAALLAASTTFATSAHAQSTHVINIGERSAAVHLPASYSPGSPAPLIILLHGYTRSGAQIESYFRFTPLSEIHGFLLVAPDGTRDPNGAQFWNATNACCNFFNLPVDDSAYLRALIDEIKAQLAVDDRRVYVVGHSNGGRMSYRMACDHADTIAAIASLAGATFLDPSACSPSTTVHTLHIHGTADRTAPYNGGCTSMGCYPGAVVTTETWATYNTCSLIPDLTSPPIDLDARIPGPETTVAKYNRDCATGGSAELWTIHGGAHRPRLSVDFSRLVVEWLLAHPKPVCPCACNFDTSTGAGVCDLIDFTTFAGLFVQGDPCACDIDTSTGMGVCDLIDFTTFAGQFAVGCP